MVWQVWELCEEWESGRGEVFEGPIVMRQGCFMWGMFQWCRWYGNMANVSSQGLHKCETRLMLTTE